MGSVPVSRKRLSSPPALLREAFGSLPAAVAYLAGKDLVVGFANEEFQQLTGDRDLLGRPLREALPELAGQGLPATLDTVLALRQPVRGHEAEFWIRRQGDQAEQIFLDFACQPVPEPGGEGGILLYAADVTMNVRDRLGTEMLTAQLTASQDRYRTLFETLPDGVIYYAADGLILGLNPAARRILGLGDAPVLTWPLPSSWQAVRADGAPLRPEEFPVSVALRTGETVADVVVGVPHEETGELRWLGVTAVPDAFDEHGQPQRAYGIFRDLTRQRRMEVAYREGHALMDRLREANVLGVVLTGEDRVHHANDAALDILGCTRDDLAAGRISYQGVTHPEYAARDAAALRQLKTAGVFHPYEKEYVRRDGHRVPVLVGGAVVSRHPLRWVTYIVDLSARWRAEQERAELLTRERAALEAARSTRERLDFLIRAGTLVASARDRHELIQYACQLAVHSLADFCVGFLPHGADMMRATSLVHRDPASAVEVADLRRYPVTMIGQEAIQAACRTGASQVVEEATAVLLRRRDLAPPLRAMVRRLQPQTLLVTPLMTGQRPLGVLALGRIAERNPFTDADVAVVEELARQMAVGLANADKLARDHTVAETLQHAVLPDSLPEISGLDLAVRYLPGADGVEVGGDWYDAFPLGGGRVGLAIGDVVGHNITSASIMSQVRNMLRAYAVDSDCPARVLERTNAALARLLPDALATVVYAVLDLATGELAYANAGHPPPVCATDAGGAAVLDDADGVMLGAPVDAVFTGGHCRLGRGATLLLYTDGLIEARYRDFGEGLAALASVIRDSAGCSAEETCAAVQAALLGDTPRADDVCLLAARPTGAAPGGRPGG